MAKISTFGLPKLPKKSFSIFQNFDLCFSKIPNSNFWSSKIQILAKKMFLGGPSLQTFANLKSPPSSPPPQPRRHPSSHHHLIVPVAYIIITCAMLARSAESAIDPLVSLRRAGNILSTQPYYINLLVFTHHNAGRYR